MKHFPDNLSEELRRWRVAPPMEPNFRPQVWQRIRARTRVTWPDYLRAHSAAWSLAAALALGAAAYTGHVAAEARARADREALVMTYLVDLDPRVQALLKSATP